MSTYEAIVVGAGAAGVGIGAALKCVGLKRFALLDRGEVGSSFLRWPRETRFISPSFTTNGFGMPDLNAITPDSSSDLLVIMPRDLAGLVNGPDGNQVLPFPIEVAPFESYLYWHANVDEDPGHRWFRELVGAALSDIS